MSQPWHHFPPGSPTLQERAWPCLVPSPGAPGCLCTHTLQAHVCAEGWSQQDTLPQCQHTLALCTHLHMPTQVTTCAHTHWQPLKHKLTTNTHLHTHLNSTVHTRAPARLCALTRGCALCWMVSHTRPCPPQLVHKHVHVQDHHSLAPQHPLPGSTYRARTSCCMCPLPSQSCQALSPWPRGKRCGIWRRATNCIAMATRHRGLISPRIQPGSWLTSEQPRATASWQGHGQDGCPTMGHGHTATSARHDRARGYLEEVLAVEGGLAHQAGQRAGNAQG